MQSDSQTNLIRSLSRSARRPIRRMVVWLVLATLAEVLLYDIVSQYFQFGVLGEVPRPLAASSRWLGLENGTLYAGAALYRVALAFVALLSLRALLIGLRDRYGDEAAAQVVYELRSRLFREAHRTSGTLIAPESAGQTSDLIERRSVDYGRSFADDALKRYLTLTRLVCAFALCVWIRLDVAVILACGIALFRLLDTAVRRAWAAESDAQALETNRIRHGLREELRESYQCRAIGSEMGQERPSTECLDRLTSLDDAFAHGYRSINAARRWGQIAIVALTLLCLATRFASDRPQPGDLIALLALGSFAAIPTILERFLRQDRSASLETPGTSAIAQLNSALTRSARIWDQSTPRLMQPCRSGLTIEKIPLGISPQDPENLKLLDAFVPARRVTAIVCPNAAFRSRLMRLLARFEDPDAGGILIDGIDLREFSIASTRLQIGTIRPEAYVNHGTVLENIALKSPRANFANVIDAAKSVHAHRMIQRLPLGYDTLVDPDKQLGELAYLQYLIALARAKWHDPSILIVEEPSAPMTRGMKELLRDAYRRLCQDRTVIIFTRHATSVLAADQVIVFGKSRVIAGEPARLMTTHKGFRRAMAEMGLGLKPENRAARPRTKKRSSRTQPGDRSLDASKTDAKPQ